MDTNVKKAPNKGGASLTDSQIVPIKDAPKTVSPSADTVDGNVSVLGESLHFKGDLSAGEDLIVEGKVEGQINQGKCSLTVNPSGQLIANVNATRIFIEGKVDGDQSATEGVTIRESGVVTGNVIAPKVAIDEGATFNGRIEMRPPSEAKGDN